MNSSEQRNMASSTIVLEKKIDPSVDISVYFGQFESCDDYSVKSEKRVSLFLANINHDFFSTLTDL